MDILDLAEENNFNAYALEQAKKNREVTPRGRCLSCEAELEVNQIYCDEFCKEDHQKRQMILKRQGRTNG